MYQMNFAFTKHQLFGQTPLCISNMLNKSQYI